MQCVVERAAANGCFLLLLLSSPPLNGALLPFLPSLSPFQIRGFFPSFLPLSSHILQSSTHSSSSSSWAYYHYCTTAYIRSVPFAVVEEEERREKSGQRVAKDYFWTMQPNAGSSLFPSPPPPPRRTFLPDRCALSSPSMLVTIHRSS